MEATTWPKRKETRKPPTYPFQYRFSLRHVLFDSFRAENCAKQIWSVRPVRLGVLPQAPTNNNPQHPQTTIINNWTGPWQRKSMLRMHVP